MRIFTEIPTKEEVHTAFCVIWQSTASIQTRQLCWDDGTGNLDMYNPEDREWFTTDIEVLQRTLAQWPHSFIAK